MKSRKNYLKILSVAVLFLIASSIYSQTTVNIPGNVNVITKEVDANGFVSYSQSGNTTIGAVGRLDQGAINVNNRSFFTFDLSSLPANITINLVELIYTSNGYSNFIGFTLTEALEKSDIEEQYNEIGNGNVFLSGLNKSIDVITLSNDIANQNIFYLGALVPNENVDLSYAAVTCSLKVKYTTNTSTTATVTFETDMDSYRNGKVTVDGITGISITKTKNIGQSVTAAAYEGSDQTHNGYKWIFNDTEAPLNKSKWQVERQLVTTLYTNNSSFTRALTAEDDGATYKSVLKKEVNVTFKNEFVGFPNLGGQIIVNNGAPENAPSASYNVVEQNTITATAINSQEFSANIGIKYDTYGWFNESGTRDYGGPTATFNPAEHETYVSKMRGTPRFSNNNYRNLRSNYGPKNINKPVRLMWNEHPNSYVTQYRVYRTATGEKGIVIDPLTMVANLNRGTTTWEDTKYVVGSSSTKIFLRYDVRAYYSIEGTMSTPEPIALNGNLLSKDTGEKDNNMGITAFAIDNFPNPFNPTTTVNYQMPYGGLVKIKVFDMLGKEVAKLVNSLKDSGSYNVKFDGGNLASGTYLVHIQVTPTDITKFGYLKTKKMLLLK